MNRRGILTLLGLAPVAAAVKPAVAAPPITPVGTITAITITSGGAGYKYPPVIVTESNGPHADFICYGGGFKTVGR